MAEHWIYINSNVEGMVFIDGIPHHGIDSKHKWVPIPRSVREAVLELFRMGETGEVPNRIEVSEITEFSIIPEVMHLANTLLTLLGLHKALVNEGKGKEAQQLIEVIDEAIGYVMP